MNNHDSMQIITSINKIKATCGVESEIASSLQLGLEGDTIDILYRLFLDIRETFNMINDIESKNITQVLPTYSMTESMPVCAAPLFGEKEISNMYQ